MVEGIPQKTRTDFKAACYRRNKTMRDVVIDFMKNFCLSTTKDTSLSMPDASDREVIFFENLPEDIHSAFKAECSRRNLILKEVLYGYMTAYAKKTRF